MATATLETDADIHGRVLEVMGAKYAETGWRRYGEPFKNGLADGSRVMIRYTPDR